MKRFITLASDIVLIDAIISVSLDSNVIKTIIVDQYGNRRKIVSEYVNGAISYTDYSKIANSLEDTGRFIAIDSGFNTTEVSFVIRVEDIESVSADVNGKYCTIVTVDQYGNRHRQKTPYINFSILSAKLSDH